MQLKADEMSDSQMNESNGRSSDSKGQCDNAAQPTSDSNRTAKMKFAYTKDELFEIRKLPLSRRRPVYLDSDFNNEKGLWCPVRWLMMITGDQEIASSGRSTKSITALTNADMNAANHLDSPKREIKHEKMGTDLLLTPQRKDFKNGCHVGDKKCDREPSGDRKEVEHGFNTLMARNKGKVGSGRIPENRSRLSEWEEPKEQTINRANNRGHSNRKFPSRNTTRPLFNSDRDHNVLSHLQDHRRENGSRSFGQGAYSHREEDEPEWYTGGPTSQDQTIELKGFDDLEIESGVKRRGSHARSGTEKCGNRQPQKEPNKVVHAEKREQKAPVQVNVVSEGMERLDGKKGALCDEKRGDNLNDLLNSLLLSSNNVVSGREVSGSVSGDVNQNEENNASRFLNWFQAARETDSANSRLERVFGVSGDDSATMVTKVSDTSGENSSDIFALFKKVNINLDAETMQTQPPMKNALKSGSVKLVSEIEDMLVERTLKNEDNYNQPLTSPNQMRLLSDADLYRGRQMFEDKLGLSSVNETAQKSKPPAPSVEYIEEVQKSNSLTKFLPTSVIRNLVKKDVSAIQKIYDEASQHKQAANSNGFTAVSNGAVLPLPEQRFPANVNLGESVPRPIIKSNQMKNMANSIYSAADIESIAKFIENQHRNQQHQSAIMNEASMVANQNQMNISQIPLMVPVSPNPGGNPNLLNHNHMKAPGIPLLHLFPQPPYNPQIFPPSSGLHHHQQQQQQLPNMNMKQRPALFDPRHIPSAFQSTAVQHFVKTTGNQAPNSFFDCQTFDKLNRPHFPISCDFNQIGEMNVQSRLNAVESEKGVAIGPPSNNENIMRWFGNDALSQRLPEMPPAPLHNALRLEELERH